MESDSRSAVATGRRRWLVLVTALVLAAIAAGVTFSMVRPSYQREASQLLVPGAGTVPEDAANPYLFLGSVSQATDIVIRAVSSDPEVKELAQNRPGTEITVRRDVNSSGPIIVITVTARTEEYAAEVLDQVLEISEATVTRLQSQQGVDPANQIIATQLSKDTRSTLKQRTRVLVSVGVGGGALVLTLGVALVLAAIGRRRRRTRSVEPEIDDSSYAAGKMDDESPSEERADNAAQGSPVATLPAQRSNGASPVTPSGQR